MIDEAKPIGSLRVLLIEDDDSHAKIISRHLNHLEGDSVLLTRACTLAQGVEHLSKEPPHVVLLDLRLPDSDMDQTLSQILRKCPQLPIIILSSIEERQLARKLVHQGAQDYLCKASLTSELLIRTIYSSIERKRAADELLSAKIEAEAANEAKSVFLANMSHEIRTPLSAILGFSELLIDQAITVDERAKIIASLQQSGELLLNIISDILDLSKAESGKLEAEIKKVSLSEILADTKEVLDLRAHQKRISLHFSTDGDVPSIIHTDPFRLKQILLNIIGNAVKFTDAGIVDVHVQWNRIHSDKPKLNFIVKDSGIGISKDEGDKLFMPFSQVDPSAKRRFGGTGLGLILSRRLANLLGGNVELIASESGKGSTFSITIDLGPVGLLPQLPLSRAENSNAQAKICLSGVKVLLAEDSPPTQFIASRVLQKAGAVVDVASNGKDALSMAHQKEYNVLLMDLQLPIVDGYTATAELRKEGYQGAIIAFTAHALVEERNRCLASGFNDYISKPINFQVLIATVARHSHVH